MKTKFCIIFAALLILFTGCQKKTVETKPMFSISETDLEIKEKPDLKSKTLETIPFGELVNLVETKGKETTLNGVTGIWYKVIWNENVNGWIFGGLSETRPDDQLIFGNLLSRIQKAKEGDTVEVT